MSGSCVLALLGLAIIGTSARAQHVLDAQALLGMPPKPVHLRVSFERGSPVLLVAGRRRVLPGGAPLHVSVESAAMAQNARVAIVRVETQGGGLSGAIVVQREVAPPEFAWVGELTLKGDPGEREGMDVVVADRDGDGLAEVVVGRVADQVRLCGERHTLFAARRFDPQLWQFVSVRHSVPLGPVPTLEREASPVAGDGPVLAGLHPASAYVAPAARDSVATWPQVAATLTDHALDTTWSGPPGSFATFTWSGSRAIDSLAIVTAPLGSERPPHEVWIIADDGTRIRARLPSAVAPGTRYAIPLPHPLDVHCLSVVLEPDLEEIAQLGIAEVEAYTDLDTPAGLGQLVAAVDAEDGDEAADQLAELGGASVAKTIRDAWPRLSPLGRGRAARIVAHTRARTGAATPDEALDVLELALKEPDLRSEALSALAAIGPKGRARVLARIGEGSAEADAIAIEVARKAPREALGPALAALAAPGGSERARLREAIAIALRGDAAQGRSSLQAWFSSHPNEFAARAALALSIARSHAGDAIASMAQSVVTSDMSRATAFADRFRLLQAARELGPSRDVDAALVPVASSAENPILRMAALDALQVRSAPEALGLARERLNDSNPRVRARAAAALGDDPGARDALTVHALRDRWPFVRIAAVETLATRSDADETLRQAVTDPAHTVRAAAVRALTMRAMRDAWPVVESRLRDPHERPDVIAESVRFTEQLCIASAAPLLLDRIRLSREPQAAPSDVDAALLALHALEHLGGEAARDGDALARKPGTPVALQSALRARGASDAERCP